ncbi:2-oxoglutarate-dependent dioxygenase 11 [Aegilops tauschii subsp. strangulata]|uniref:Fe2OG dioxygenase domain-containing protein n=2 Tax=Aegilops tauschii subsp. strangulata TaxID=200361 RepID=A0A453ML16_AEGTS|nr:2-oxoglutarate-dependent dioxygenase 11 [Aegilops tauschii subsp. strangulata]
MVRTTVQELAAAVEEPPRQYVVAHEQDQDLLAADEMPEPILLIDLSRLTTADAADEADKLRAALQTWGLFLVTNHGIEESLMDAMMSASREFFRQPSGEKQKCSNLIDDGGKHSEVEGYGNDKVVNQDEGLSWNDRLHLRVEPEDERNFTKWPTHPESFRDVLLEYASRTKRIRDVVFRTIAKLLDLDEDYFLNQMSNKDPGFARFNYYPPCPRPDLVLGMRPHSDAGLLTILFVDRDVGGLQVERDGKWYNVPAKPYSLVINLADCMEIMCNGIFRSPVHRVVTNAEKERLSLAVFYAVDGETVLEPAPGLLDDERPPRYGKFKAKDFGLSFD